MKSNTNRFSTIQDVEEYLDAIPKFGLTGAGAANFDLERMIRFCRLIGNPERAFASIHVAGTNGKGTTCQMLAAIYQSAGYKTGLYTSPHLLHVRERFRIDGRDMDDESLLRFFREFEELIESEKLTFFELTTVIAFWYFSVEHVDVAILETGLGGRLDATNVVDPLVSVITSVGMDHAEILGNTLEQIATEKAGIIKPGKPVITGNLSPPARKVISDIAKKHNAPLREVSQVLPTYKDGKIILKGAGNYAGQQFLIPAASRKRIDAVNAAMSLLAIDTAYSRFPVKAGAITDGMKRLDELFPRHAHFERLIPDTNWYFDGAHNPEATEILIEELLSRSSADKWMVVLSFMDDKLTGDVARLWNRFPRIRYYIQESKRAATRDKLEFYFPEAHEIRDFREIFNGNPELSKSELVIFSGSFYFYEKVRRWMGTMSAK
jgi:dihydrofolate synthase / folylpolyglutamate synthase